MMSTATKVPATSDTEQFEQLARRAAGGEKVSREEIEAVAAGCTERFNSLVSQFSHRNDLRKRIGRCEAIRGELNDLEAANVDEKRSMDKALEEFHKRQQVRRQRIDEIVGAMSNWHADQSTLFATAPVAMRNRHAAAAKEVERLRTATKALGAKVDSHRRFGHSDLATKLEEELKQSEARLADAIAEKQTAYDAAIAY